VRLLLDTHILLWWQSDDPALPARANMLIAAPANEIFASAISLWEIAIKTHLGKLRAAVNEVCAAALDDGFEWLPFSVEHALAVAQLPEHHRDPFDRALIAQARCGPLYLLTHDSQLGASGEPVLLA